jgi:hypothetical protein
VIALLRQSRHGVGILYTCRNFGSLAGPSRYCPAKEAKNGRTVEMRAKRGVHDGERVEVFDFTTLIPMDN